MRHRWFRPFRLAIGVAVMLVIVSSWIDSRYHRTTLSMGGRSGAWCLNCRSAISIGCWTGDSSSWGAHFHVHDRDPKNFTWFRKLRLEHEKYGIGHTLYLPHYVLLTTWVVVFVFGTAMREIRIRRVEQRIAEQASASEGDQSSI